MGCWQWVCGPPAGKGLRKQTQRGHVGPLLLGGWADPELLGVLVGARGSPGPGAGAGARAWEPVGEAGCLPRAEWGRGPRRLRRCLSWPPAPAGCPPDPLCWAGLPLPWALGPGRPCGEVGAGGGGVRLGWVSRDSAHGAQQAAGSRQVPHSCPAGLESPRRPAARSPSWVPRPGCSFPGRLGVQGPGDPVSPGMSGPWGAARSFPSRGLGPPPPRSLSGWRRRACSHDRGGVTFLQCGDQAQRRVGPWSLVHASSLLGAGPVKPAWALSSPDLCLLGRRLGPHQLLPGAPPGPEPCRWGRGPRRAGASFPPLSQPQSPPVPLPAPLGVPSCCPRAPAPRPQGSLGPSVGPPCGPGVGSAGSGRETPSWTQPLTPPCSSRGPGACAQQTGSWRVTSPPDTAARRDPGPASTQEGQGGWAGLPGGQEGLPLAGPAEGAGWGSGQPWSPCTPTPRGGWGHGGPGGGHSPHQTGRDVPCRAPLPRVPCGLAQG